MDKHGIALKIRELRKAKGLSQEEVAARAKIAHRAVQRVETGESNPTLDTLLAIGKVLGFDPYIHVGGGAEADTFSHHPVEALAFSLAGAVLTKLADISAVRRRAVLSSLFEDSPEVLAEISGLLKSAR